MKGFLIFIVLFLGSGIYLFTHTREMGQKAWDQVILEEGSAQPAFRELMFQDPAAFKAKYQAFMQRRATIAKWMDLLGETGLLLALSRETQKLYDESTLNTDPAYGEILMRKADALLEGRDIQSGEEAWRGYKRYLELFPAGPRAGDAQMGVAAMVTRYAFQ
jgi:hypothetical protein